MIHKKTSFKKIRYFLESLLAYFFFYLFKLLPIRIASKFGIYIVYPLSKILSVNKVAINNINICFPNEKSIEKQQILKKTWKHFGSMLGEMPHWNDIDQKEFRKRVKIKYHTKINFKGALLISAHLGNWELMTRIAKEENIDLCTVYRPANNPYINDLINKLRSQYNALLIKKGTSGIRTIIKSLKQKRTVGMLIDQKTNDGIELPFFGIDAKTTSAPANIALKYNVPIIPVKFIRTKGINYKVEFFKPIHIELKDDVYSIMGKINKIFEQWIIENPEQWFWFHNRWPKNSDKV